MCRNRAQHALQSSRGARRGALRPVPGGVRRAARFSAPRRFVQSCAGILSPRPTGQSVLCALSSVPAAEGGGSGPPTAVGLGVLERQAEEHQAVACAEQRLRAERAAASGEEASAAPALRPGPRVSRRSRRSASSSSVPVGNELMSSKGSTGCWSARGGAQRVALQHHAQALAAHGELRRCMLVAETMEEPASAHPDDVRPDRLRVRRGGRWDVAEKTLQMTRERPRTQLCDREPRDGGVRGPAASSARPTWCGRRRRSAEPGPVHLQRRDRRVQAPGDERPARRTRGRGSQGASGAERRRVRRRRKVRTAARPTALTSPRSSSSACR